MIGFTDYRTVSLVVERHLDTVEVRGSSPLRCTILQSISSSIRLDAQLDPLLLPQKTESGPNHFDIVGFHQWVPRNQPERFALGLGNQDPIERISMMTR